MVALERFARIERGSVADVAAFGIQDEHDVWVLGANVIAHSLQLRLGANGGKVCNLWFECARSVGSGINNVDAELLNAQRIVAKMRRHFVDVGIDTNTQRRIAGCPGAVEFLVEIHAE